MGDRSNGSARLAILEASRALLLELGAERLTIRRVEARSGFKAASLCGVPRRANPVEYLRELARAYVRFGLSHPTHYQLISAPRPEPARRLASAEAARELVFRALLEASDTGSLGGRDPEAVFQALWAMLHGVVSLTVSRPDHPWRPELVDLALETIERGLLTKEGPR
jgi:AcrR family transcriptional regulator